MCLQKMSTSSVISWESPQLIGYVELTVFREISPEHSLIDREQKVACEFIFLIIFSPWRPLTHHSARIIR